MPAEDAMPSPTDLLRRIDAMAGQPLILAADLVADRFISGSPKRISREAPVLILSWESERLTPGGGANAAANVAALGGRPLTLGLVGDDENGEALRRTLEERGLTTEGLRTRPGYRTPTKTRILGGGAIKQQIVRYDIEDWITLADEERRARRRCLETWARDRAPTVAVLSDYGYGTVEPGLVEDLRDTLGPSARLLCDSRYRLADFSGLDGATPNQEEAEALLGHPLGSGGDDSGGGLEASGRALMRRLGTRFLLITRGSRGMSLFLPRRTFHLPVHGTDQVADVTGAGDTVIGTFALAQAAGAGPLEAALLANFAAGVVVMKMGTATVSPDELGEAVESDPHLLDAVEVEAAAPEGSTPAAGPEAGSP